MIRRPTNIILFKSVLLTHACTCVCVCVYTQLGVIITFQDILAYLSLGNILAHKSVLQTKYLLVELGVEILLNGHESGFLYITK